MNPWQRLQAHEAVLSEQGMQWGAVATFVGTMRDFNEGESVEQLFLEHYSGMTEHYLQQISEQAAQQWEILESLIIHRVGEIKPGETIVLIGVWAMHRAAAFRACQFLIEELKHRAPFWKKERLAVGSSRWVTQNTPG